MDTASSVMSSPAVVIVGGGTMGADVATVFARGGWSVTVVEPGAERRRVLEDYWARRPDDSSLEILTGAVSTVPTLADAPWPRTRVMVECAPERLDVKRSVFADCVALARPDAILTSNSSSFPISRIAEGLKTRERMLGLHFFMPAHLVPLVEVVSAAESGQETATAMMRIMTDLGRVPVHVRRDLPGFLANRMQHAMAREAFALIEEGIASAEDVDKAVRFGFGFRFLAAGPALQRDHAGLDVHCAAAETMYPTLSRAAEPSVELRRRVAEGRLGMKAGAGFFSWSPQDIRKEKERYDGLLLKGLELLAEELPPIRPPDVGEMDD